MMINEMKNSRSSDLLPMFYDCKYLILKVYEKKKKKLDGRRTSSGPEERLGLPLTLKFRSMLY